ncbi:14812_t:CDS:2, partial [Racocetra persica]
RVIRNNGPVEEGKNNNVVKEIEETESNSEQMVTMESTVGDS